MGLELIARGRGKTLGLALGLEREGGLDVHASVARVGHGTADPTAAEGERGNGQRGAGRP